MREIVKAIAAPGSIQFTFTDHTVVHVVFQPTTPDNNAAYESARVVAQQFAEKLPPGRWEGKIDGSGKVLESPIKV